MKIYDNINVFDYLKKVYSNRKLIFKIITAFFLIGLLFAFFNRKEYLVSIEFVNVKNSPQGGLNGIMQKFGGLSGLELGSIDSEDEIMPLLYNDVLNNADFFQKLLQKEVYIQKDSLSCTLSEYLKKHLQFSLNEILIDYTFKLPFKIKGLFIKDNSNHVARDTTFIQFSEEEEAQIKQLKDRIDIKIDKVTGKISISFQFPDKYAAANVVTWIYNYLNDYIVRFKVQKAQDNLDFLNERLIVAKSDFLITQEKLASYRDSNKDIISVRARSEEERLLSEYNIAQTVYNLLIQQYEQSKLKVQEDKPVLKVIKPVVIPNVRYSPNKTYILLLSIFLGSVIAICYVLLKSSFSVIKNIFI